MKLWSFKQKRANTVRRRRLDEPNDESLSAQSTLFSYRRHSNLTRDPASPRHKIHHLKKKQKSFGLLFLVAVFAIIIVFWLLYQFSGSIKVSLYGQVTQSTDLTSRYETRIDLYFKQHPLQRLRFLTNLDMMTRYFQNTDSQEVESVKDVRPSGVGASRFIVKVRQPVAVWVIDRKTHYVDKYGVIFDTNYFDKPVVKISDQSGLSDVMSGEILTVTSRRFLDFIGQSVGRLVDSGLLVRQVVIPPNTTRMVEFELKDHTLIRMTVDRPVGEQVEDTLVAINYSRQKKMRLKYVDVRVGGRAFYKPR